MPVINTPKRQVSYTFREICQMQLNDTPHLTFTHNGEEGVIQDDHLDMVQLLNVPGMAKSRWLFICEIEGYTPIFKYDDHVFQPAITDLVDLEEMCDLYKSKGDPSNDFWWATPKGYPRKQNEEMFEDAFS